MAARQFPLKCKWGEICFMDAPFTLMAFSSLVLIKAASALAPKPAGVDHANQ